MMAMALIASLAVNVYSCQQKTEKPATTESVSIEKSKEDEQPPKEKGPCECDADSRYISPEADGGGHDIKNDDAKILISDYRTAHSTDATIYQTTGFHISYKALEDIFANCENNSLAIDLVKMDGRLNVILSGYRTDKTQITTPNGSHIYTCDRICPLDCNTW